MKHLMLSFALCCSFVGFNATASESVKLFDNTIMTTNKNAYKKGYYSYTTKINEESNNILRANVVEIYNYNRSRTGSVGVRRNSFRVKIHSNSKLGVDLNFDYGTHPSNDIKIFYIDKFGPNKNNTFEYRIAFTTDGKNESFMNLGEFIFIKLKTDHLIVDGTHYPDSKTKYNIIVKDVHVQQTKLKENT